ncbi:hypothetical protein RND71_039666 [Anisodus tanguticus]|uniref:Uncharacterized protein n=1 Tax=Anisodus tanguticus TaxID=243964 RepID=A0AAE1QWW8_9SOLA|nr:hypothetical protein RND71_039666 [Anisodus tanguticus]
MDSAITKEIKLTRMEAVKNISENPSTFGSAQQSIQIIEEEPVGFEDDANRIIQLLTIGRKELDIISVVGMAGLGKTTLAKKVFKHQSVVLHFDVRVWCTISQTYDVRELLFDIFKQVERIKFDMDMDSSDIADMLRKSLKSKRYLIVLDDIWEDLAWDDLRLSFPDDRYGSRIILTTRLKQVAMQVKRYSEPYCLRFLTLAESWKLLQKKVFQKKACPPEFWDLGLQVAEYCKGLPLVIILIGGIIAMSEKIVSKWSEIANSLKTRVGAIETKSDEAVELSYRYLPNHLKPCLLYLGRFPEDYEIRASQLILFWLGEGFAQCSDERRLEEVVEGYLMDLISSSLLMVSKTASNGKVKYCKVHDKVREFCLNKAEEEKFMQVVGSHNQYRPSACGEQRLCIYADSKLRKNLDEIDMSINDYLTSNSKSLRSLLVTNDKTFGLYHNPICVFSLVRHLRLLRVLDLMNFHVEYSWYEVLRSLHFLRYLAVCCREFEFYWVLHLSHLETLLVNTVSGVRAPSTIWKLTKLRHVSVGVHFPMRKTNFGEPKLENLRTFNGIYYEVGDGTERLLERFPNLQELSLVPQCRSKICSLNLQVLTELQSLFLSLLFVKTKFVQFSFPSSLKKLALYMAHVSRGATSTIAKLPILEKLKFDKCTFDKNEWDVTESEFQALKVLRVQSADTFRKWHASESSFPVLEILVLKSCSRLKKIPYSFGDVQTLKSIDVLFSNASVEASAFKIKEDLEANTGCDNLVLYGCRYFHREEKEGEETEVESENEAREEEKEEEVEKEEEREAQSKEAKEREIEREAQSKEAKVSERRKEDTLFLFIFLFSFHIISRSQLYLCQ